MASNWKRMFVAALAGILVAMSATSAAQATDDDLSSTAQSYLTTCGDFRPTSGSFLPVRIGDEFRVTWNFRLSSAAKQALDCVANTFHQPLLELELALKGFGGVNDWDDYQVVATNIPGAVHDVGWRDAAKDAAPGITNIPISALEANTSYYFGIRWTTTSSFYPLAGVTQRVSFQLAPSHWYDPYNAYEAPCVFTYTANGFNPAWCVFPGGTAFISGQHYDFFAPPDDGIPFGNALTQPYVFPRVSPNGNGSTTGGSGSSSGSPTGNTSSPTPSRLLFLRGDSAVFAKDGLENGGWTQESDSGSIKEIAVGGPYQMVLNACNAVYARSDIGRDGWVQETPCGGANKIAVSNTGLQMLIDSCGAVWAKYGIGMGGWTQEASCGNADAIAAGGHNQLFLRGDKAVFWRSGVGTDWAMQVGPANAVAIAADNTGMFAFARHDGALFAKRGHYGDGGWQQQAGPGNTYNIAAGGGVLAFIRGDGAVFAKRDISQDGHWQQQADPGTVNLLDVGDNGRIMIRSNTNAVYAKDNLVNGDWKLQVGDGNAEKIAVG
jgi:hypothetical protein